MKIRSAADFSKHLEEEISVRTAKKLVPEIAIAVNRAKDSLISSIIQHPVSQEISNGSDSSFLPNGGSMFGFLGFRSGQNPISDLTQYLESNIDFEEEKTFIAFRLLKTKSIISVRLPTKKSIRESLPSAWESGKSWVELIEDGSPNYQFFLSKKAGRSQEGVQIDNLVTQETFVGTPYLTPLISDFRKTLLLYLRSITL